METKVSKRSLSILEAIPRSFIGANMYDHLEVEAASRVVAERSPFRYYGYNMLNETNKFEESCTKYFGVKYAHTVNSGTGALSCALHMLDVGPGDEVIIPGYFWSAVVNTTVIRGGIPVLCEVDETLNLDPADLKRKISEKTKCVLLIHMDGSQARMQEIREICDQYGVKILEDFSQCIGGSIDGQMIGSFGDVAIASFQLNKMISSGEGGLLLTDSEEYYYKALARSDFGFQRIGGMFQSEPSNSYITYGEGRRFNEISAAIMNVQLQKLPAMVEKIRTTKARMKAHLGDISPVRFRTIVDEEGDIGSTLILIFNTSADIDLFWELYNSNFPKKELRIYRLSETGFHIYYNCTNLVEKIEALPGGFPWSFVEHKNYYYGKGALPATDDLLYRSLALKLTPNLTPEQEMVMADCLKNLLQEFKSELLTIRK